MKAVVFDLDGTLIDSAPDIHAAANRMLAEEGAAPLDLATLTSFIGHGLPNLVTEVMGARGLPVKDHTRLTQATYRFYSETPTALTRFYPGVLDALTGLSENGWRLGICTNKPIVAARQVLDLLGIADRFDSVTGGDSLPTRKPDPAMLFQCFDTLKATERFYIGDSETDAETARRAGIDFGLFTKGYRKTPAEDLPARFRFSDFARLGEMIDATLAQTP